MRAYKCDTCGKMVNYPSDHKWTCARYNGESEV